MNFGPKELERIALLTGLTVSMCVHLLDRGWTYVERIDGRPTWEKGVTL